MYHYISQKKKTSHWGASPAPIRLAHISQMGWSGSPSSLNLAVRGKRIGFWVVSIKTPMWCLLKYQAPSFKWYETINHLGAASFWWGPLLFYLQSPQTWVHWFGKSKHNKSSFLCHVPLYLLVVSTHLHDISQNGNLPQVGVEIKNIWNHHLTYHLEQHNSTHSQCWPGSMIAKGSWHGELVKFQIPGVRGFVDHFHWGWF